MTGDLQKADDQAWETDCPGRDDKIHCVHWYDGEKCCACGDPAEETGVGALVLLREHDPSKSMSATSAGFIPLKEA